MTELDDSARKFFEKVQGYKRKRAYEPVFGEPQDDWIVEANWEDAYYRASIAMIEGVAKGRYPKAVEGVAGLYLVRHYLELALKYIVLHARWLSDPKTNAKPEEVQAVRKTHSLQKLWEWAKAEAMPKIGREHWDEWDTEFVDACIAEWERVDPHPGARFRYYGESFGGAQPEGNQYLWIDFERLLRNLPHVREVLGMIDLYLYETHGQNEDFEADMASW